MNQFLLNPTTEPADYYYTMKTKALLYIVDGIWTVEPLFPTVGSGRQFATTRNAREWARLNRVSLRRDKNCDSK